MTSDHRLTGRRTANLTREKKAIFLRRFSEVGTITSGAQEAGIDRHTHYAWMRQDPDYARDFAAAEHVAAESLEAEARRRAVDGVDEPVFHGGEVVGAIRRYSDTLLIFLLKGAMPSKYRERVTVDVSVKDEVSRFAAELGIDVDEAIAEAERVLAEAR